MLLRPAAEDPSPVVEEVVEENMVVGLRRGSAPEVLQGVLQFRREVSSKSFVY